VVDNAVQIEGLDVGYYDQPRSWPRHRHRYTVAPLHHGFITPLQSVLSLCGRSKAVVVCASILTQCGNPTYRVTMLAW
jgi:hypothetical protein